MALSMCGRRIFLTRNSLLRSTKRHGYIVLVPEIGEDLPDKNPLLEQNGLPEFNNITIENCIAAIGKQTSDFESNIKDIEENLLKEESKDICKDIFNPLEKLGGPLNMTWGLSKTLYLGNNTLMPTKTYLGIHERARRARSVKYNSYPIYNAILNELKVNKQLSNELERVVKKFALEGQLNGLNLKTKNRAILAENLNKLVVEKGKFKTKNDASTKKFVQSIFDEQVVRDFPNNLLKSMAVDPNNAMKGPWMVTLQPHIYHPFMEYCPDRELRWNVWQALVSRGTGYRDKEFETSSQIEEIRLLRRDQAKLLGYPTYADMSMETKMAGSVENVKNMLQMLLDHSKPSQEKELESLYNFAVDSGFKGSRIELWDVPYWRRKQQLSVFNYKDEEFRKYFPLNKVLNGLFDLCERLFSITIKLRYDVSTWHKDVKFYDIFESHSSAPVAGFYLDLFARDHDKIRTQNNGWMVAIQNFSRIAETKPLAALVFNFEQPTNQQSLLLFKDVQLLFNKFGHALQHLLSRTTYSEVSGLSNIEWDAVEVSGYVLSHWLYNKSTIDSITSHCESEDKLPDYMFETLLKVHKHMAGLDLSQELYLSALDIEFHSTKDFWLSIVKRLWPQYCCFPLDKYDSHPCSFTQIFTDEWGAAYYSHIWSRMIAADVYSAFHEVQGDEEQVLDVGKRFRNTFLALGGSCHPSEVFRKFRGRDPSPKALLSSLGLKKKKVETL